MKIFILTNDDDPVSFTPKEVTVIAESLEEALSIAHEKYGTDFELLREAEITKGVIDSHY